MLHLPLALSLLTASVGQVSDGKIEYRKKRVTVQKFRDMCRKPSVIQLTGKGVKKLEGSAVLLVGTLKAVEGSDWSILLADSKPDKPVTVNVSGSRFKETRLKPGHNLVVGAIFREAGPSEGIFWELLPPGLKWEYKLEKPAAVVGGQTQSFKITGRVKNTGTQALRDVEVSARLWQLNSPNDFTKKFTIDELPIGATREFEVDFSAYQFEYIGATSVPKVALAVTGYDF